MRHPKQADRVVETAYAISMAVYILVAVCGYIMYGTNVSDEVSGSCAKSGLLITRSCWLDQ
jgi:vesicular inhibitory amino acid transporter